MGYERFIAGRYLRPKRSQLFVGLTTLLTTLGVALGVAALIVVLSGMNGFAGEILRQLIGMNAHLWVRSSGGTIAKPEELIPKIRRIPGVTGVSSTIYEETLLANPPYARTGAQIKAVDTTTVSEVSHIVDLMTTDTANTVGWFDLGRSMDDVPGMVIGWNLANKLQVFVGEKIYLVVTSGMSNAATSLMVQPRLEPFRITGIFNTGFFEFDATLAIVELGEAQRVFGLGNEITALEVRLDDAFAANTIGPAIAAELGGYPYMSSTWIDLNGGLYKWLMIEKWFAFVILSLIILVAAFNIVSTLSMVVIDKTKEIGILKAMGATSREVSRLFMYQGVIVGVVGTGLGGLIGYLLCWMQDTYKLITLPADLYQVSAFPVEMRLFDFVAIGSAAMLICLGSAIYPAWKAAKMHPVEAIRHE
jgi:lipoprotein-releasing system permease protein